MPRPRFAKKDDTEIVKQAREACKRDPETNAIVEASLIDEVQKRISFDPITEHRRKAERLVKECERPAKTPPNGTLWLPGFDPVDYEPEQLIPDGEGLTVERDLATAHFVDAALQRANQNLRRVEDAFRRASVQADTFAQWAIDQSISGRPSNEITFGNFVRENGYWQAEL